MAKALRTTPSDPSLNQMTEEEFVKELIQSLLILSTTSPDKRDIYRLLLSSHDKNPADHPDKPYHAGANLYFLDSGALGLAPRKTDERTNQYGGNLFEKSMLQLAILSDPVKQKSIRTELSRADNEFDARRVNIIGMTEDSGWEINFENKEIEKEFIERIIAKLQPLLREKDHKLLDELHKTGFPGPNLKPLQECLGGFHKLMRVIYDVSEEMNLGRMDFTNTVNVSFVSPASGKYFAKEFKSTGELLTRDEYEERLLTIRRGEAINSNFVQIPNDQKNGERKTIDMLIKEGLHTVSSKVMPASYARRDITEWMQGLIGKRRSTVDERKRDVNIAYVTPDALEGKKLVIKGEPVVINDYKPVSIPTRTQLMDDDNMRPFGDADVVVLVPSNGEPLPHNKLRSDPNLRMLLNFIVTAETDPESMGVPVILDNRSGGFNPALKLISDAFLEGRLMGDPPFLVANTTEELDTHLRNVKDMKQRAPRINKDISPIVAKPEDFDRVPADGVFSVFVGGGHANNSKQDINDASNFGYYCASQGWRIVTGAGSLEGSMGAIHTGFIQYHLDHLTKHLAERKRVLAIFERDHEDQIKHPEHDNAAAFTHFADEAKAIRQIEGIMENLGFDRENFDKFDAEDLIKDEPDLIDELANLGAIPRDMFYGYSMEPLLEMESHSGKAPPGITFFDTGNRVRRLGGLLAPGTKVLMRGSIGTDEEFEETVKQHLDARIHKQDHGHANNNVFSDGTPDDKGAIIIYNVDGNLDKLLDHYGLQGNGTLATINRKKHNIVVVDTLDELKEATKSRETEAQSWLERLKKRAESPVQAIAV